MYRSFLKRVADILISLLAIIILLVPMLVIALIIRIDTKGAALFKQERAGKGKKPFYILKFRTMRTDAPSDAPTHSLKEPERWITGVGKFLRRTGLDELPQVFNIFVGQMSLVGPRPLVLSEEDVLAERDKNGANDLRPGLTGWAQINGRDKLSAAEKVTLDGEYAARLGSGFFAGIFMDIRCIFGTVPVVLGFGRARADGAKAADDKNDRQASKK